MNEPKNAVEAVQTSLDILEAIQNLEEAGITELANELDLTKGTVHNHISTLRYNDYIIKTENDTYQLGLRFLDVAHHAKKRIGVYDIVRQEVDKLAHESGEMALFTVEEHGIGICLYRSLGKESIETVLHVGYRSHLHHTAVGKAILANLPQENVEEIIERRGLPRLTEDTVTKPHNLYEELEQIRERGIAFNRGETIHGLSGAGAPVIAPGGNVAGAISIIGPTRRMNEDRLYGDISDMLLKSANIIEVNATSI